MNCRICKTECVKEFSANLIKKYQVNYYFCPHCGYLQLDELSHLSEAYNNSITSSDVGLLARNNRYTEQLAPFFYFYIQICRRHRHNKTLQIAVKEIYKQNRYKQPHDKVFFSPILPSDRDPLF